MMDALMDIMHSEQDNSIRLASTLGLSFPRSGPAPGIGVGRMLTAPQLPFTSRTA